jgi:hypothetical protein
VSVGPSDPDTSLDRAAAPAVDRVAAPALDRSVGPRLAEAVVLTAGGAVLGGLAWSPLGPGAAVSAAVVAGANGAISGWRGVYGWSCAPGAVAFVLDSTWAVVTTAASLGSHVIGVVRGRPGYIAELSERQHRHVYARGFQPRRGFLITVGNVISGAGDTSVARRRRVVTDHEDVHVWQTRWLGPLFPLLYGGWMAVGGVAGAGVWAARRVRGRRDASFSKVVESCAYYLNPFEWWAYSRDAAWPPSGKVPGLGWRRPMVRPLARQSVRR